jgi:hypothetical protein
VQYRLPSLTATSERNALPLHPVLPRCFVSPNNYLVSIADKWKPKEQRLFGKLLQPAFVRKLRVLKPKVAKTLRVSINQCCHAKFLGESAKLAKGCWTLKKINKVSFHSSLREEAKSLARIRTFLDSKDLYFQRVALTCQRRTERMKINPVPAIDAA